MQGRGTYRSIVETKEAAGTPHLRIGEAADYLCQALVAWSAHGVAPTKLRIFAS
jgi:hypothetical protein